MPDHQGRTTESEISFAILIILNTVPSGRLSIQDLILELPKVITFTDADKEDSESRDGEQKWEQRVRNIKSHSNTDGNYIAEGWLKHVKGGLEITPAGRAFLESRS